MPSRRARKRYRRPGADAGLRGDREKPPPLPPPAASARGVRGVLCGEWEAASRSDLLLFRKAIKEDWPVPIERRRPLMEAALSPIGCEDTPVRLLLAIARLAVAADMHDLGL